MNPLDTFLPFAKPSICEKAINEVVDSLKSGWITTGPKVQRFEQAMMDYCQSPIALSVSSATAGLFLALKALSLSEGDEVITTPMTFAATLNVIVQNGLKPVLVDVDPNTYNMDVDQIEQVITEKTKVIMPVHFAGCSVDLDRIYDIAKKYNLRVIEDCAHAIGSSYKGKKLGSFGDIQVFSFHPNKNMTTGEGGCITLRDEALAQTISQLRFHGMDRTAWDRFSKKGSQHYEIVTPGYKFNLMDIQAALGIHQLEALDGFIEKRHHLVERYRNRLANIPFLQLPQDPDYEHTHAWHLFAPRIVHPNFTRDNFMIALKEFNVGTGLHYKACHLYPFYAETFHWKRDDFPNAEFIGDHIVSLPLFPDLSEELQDKVIDIIHYLLLEYNNTETGFYAQKPTGTNA